VEESLIEATPSRKSLFDKIDEANKSILKDHSIMSKESIECDQIRINRIEKERLRKNNQELERLFCDSRLAPE
jgi:hypothetical protein